MKNKSVTQIVLTSLTFGAVHYAIGYITQKAGYNYTPSVTKSLILVACLIAVDAMFLKSKPTDKNKE